MSRGVSGRDRRVLLAGSLAVLALVAGSRGAPAWLAWHREAAASAAEMNAELSLARASIRAMPLLRDSLELRRRRLAELAPVPREGASPSVAAGALAALVSDAAARASMRLTSVQVQADTVQARSYAAASVRAGLEGDIRGLMSLLLKLEHGPDLIAIRKITITQPDPSASSDRPEALRVELVVQRLSLPMNAGVQ